MLLTLVWGTTWAAIRLGLAGIPPFTGVALRFAIAGTLLLALAPLVGARFEWSRRELALWLLNGGLTFTVSYGIVYWAEQFIPSGLTAVLFATQPLLIAALAHVALPGERLTAPAVAGLLLGFAGVATLFSADFARLGGAGAVRAALVMLGSPLVTAVATVAVKRWGTGLHPISLTAVPMLMTAAIMGAAARAFEADRSVVLDLRSLGALLYLAVLGSALTFTVFYWLLARVPATRASLIAYTVPVVALVTGALVFDEPLLPRVLAGTALIVGGVVLVSRPHRPVAG